MEDGATIATGGVGRAVAGAVLAGGVGAIVGAGTRKSTSVINSLKIRITTSDISNAMRIIDVITTQTKKGDFEYPAAEGFVNEVYSVITSIIANNTPSEVVDFASDTYSELEKLTSLRDKGVLTEAEYQETKKRLLDRI